MLDGAQHAQGVVALTLEGQHRVDQVLEHAGPGDRPFLVDVAHEHGGEAAVLGHGRQHAGALPHLGHGPGRRTQRGLGDGLYGVDHEDVGLQLADSADDGGQRPGREQPEIGLEDAEALGPQPHLLGRFLSGDEQAARPRAGQLPQHLHHQGGLSDAGLPGDQGDRAGDEAAGEHPVELVQPRRPAAPGHALDARDGLGARRGSGPQPPTEPRAGPWHRQQGRPAELLDQGVPRAARRATARPAGRLGAALAAAVDGPGPRHATNRTQGL